MKTTFKKKLSLAWVAFILLFSLTVPVTGVFANSNGGATTLEKEGITTPADEEKTEEGIVNHSGKSEEQTEDKEPAEKQKNNESKQAKNNESKQAENDESKQAENDESKQAENDESKQAENNESKQAKNNESKQAKNNESKQAENDESNQKENDVSNQAVIKEKNQGDKKSEEVTKENGNKSTEVHLHLEKCKAPVVKAEVQLKGEWKEMSNPGNSPLYKLKDGGEFVKDEITAFRLTFESGEKQVYGMDELRIGVEAEGSINYWLEGCQIAEDGQEENPGEGTENPGEGTENPGEGKENPGEGKENPGEGTEEPGDGQGDDQGNKSTEIHLHLKNCVAPVEKVFVELNGEWVEMSNPGNSPLYKLKDGGEFVKDDITAFKLQFESGTNRTYSVDEIKTGVEAEGSINYWLEDCAIPEGENPEEPGDNTEEPGDNTEEPGEDEGSDVEIEVVKELYITINKNIESVVKVTLLIKDGENLELINVNNLWKLFITNGLNISDITGIEIEFGDGTTKLVTLNMLSFELENQIIQVDIDEAVLGIDSEDDTDEDAGAVQPENNDNDSSGQGDEKQSSYGGMLPKTGENSKVMFYIIGFLLMTAGLVLRMKKPINQL